MNIEHSRYWYEKQDKRDKAIMILGGIFLAAILIVFHFMGITID